MGQREPQKKKKKERKKRKLGGKGITKAKGREFKEKDYGQCVQFCC